MTYKHLKKRISSKEYADIPYNFDLMPKSVKSKIILGVGCGIENAMSYLSSIIRACEKSQSRFAASDLLELKDRFIFDDSIPFTSDIAEAASEILKKAKNQISSEELLFLTSLSILDGRGEYLLIEIGADFYINYLSKCDLIPYAVVFSSMDDNTLKQCIDSTKQGVKEIIAMSEDENFDYISKTYASYGARLSYCSKNKIIYSSSSLFSTEFYYFNPSPFEISSPDKSNITYAALAIESAKAILSATKAQIYQGIKRARLFFDFEIRSLEPMILLKIEHLPFSLPEKYSFSYVRDGDPFSYPKGNTVFYGSAEYLEGIKGLLNQ